jgi:hypothetical protein
LALAERYIEESRAICGTARRHSAIFRRNDFMPNHRIYAAALVALFAGAAFAQQPPQSMRFAGTVKSVTTDELILSTANGDVALAITPRTRVVVRQPGAASDIKPGAYLGTSNQDSTLPSTGTATEVHIMDNGPNVNYPMNNSGLTMTNGHVKSVTTTAKGEEMDIDYGQASPRHVVVGKDTSISRMVDVGAKGLKPGLAVNAMTATGSDGKKTASFISITSAAQSTP